jgi:hypothetical protein
MDTRLGVKVLCLIAERGSFVAAAAWLRSSSAMVRKRVQHPSGISLGRLCGSAGLEAATALAPDRLVVENPKRVKREWSGR